MVGKDDDDFAATETAWFFQDKILLWRPVFSTPREDGSDPTIWETDDFRTSGRGFSAVR